jgi:hypothetical protein
MTAQYNEPDPQCDLLKGEERVHSGLAFFASATHRTVITSYVS